MIGAIAAAGAAKSIAGDVGDFFSSYDKDKDARRREGNTRAFNAATAPGGSVEAFKYLKGRSGKFGSILVGPIAGVDPGGMIGGWASEPARADAYAKYQALAPRYETGTLPAGDGRASDVGGVDPLTGRPTSTTAHTAAGLTPLVLGIGALLALAWLMRGRS